MKKVLIISRYLRAKENLNLFHFKGYFHGQRINQIAVKGGKFEKGHDYALALESVVILDKVLVGELVKSKKLS
ncbi:MAG: hypothetical protein CME65_09330 [Halobacteriovoraceae bacterium]|nr:hypothetical protein [Halobacteriovoraceae bacterium]|tara:strand:+ start:5277 stop:5495 length:219 start_codon:yes stop_codon:yes gene_type:complete